MRIKTISLIMIWNLEEIKNISAGGGRPHFLMSIRVLILYSHHAPVKATPPKVHVQHNWILWVKKKKHLQSWVGRDWAEIEESMYEQSTLYKISKKN